MSAEGCASAAVAGGAEGAEVRGFVGAAVGDGGDVIDFESGFGGAAAAGLARVVVALEDEEAERSGDGLAAAARRGEEFFTGDAAAFAACEEYAGVAE